MTAQPFGGPPRSGDSFPDGGTRKFTAAGGGTNAYSNALSYVTIDTGWDPVTRPPSVVINYIIKHD